MLACFVFGFWDLCSLRSGDISLDIWRTRIFWEDTSMHFDIYKIYLFDIFWIYVAYILYMFLYNLLAQFVYMYIYMVGILWIYVGYYRLNLFCIYLRYILGIPWMYFGRLWGTLRYCWRNYLSSTYAWGSPSLPQSPTDETEPGLQIWSRRGGRKASSPQQGNHSPTLRILGFPQGVGPDPWGASSLLGRGFPTWHPQPQTKTCTGPCSPVLRQAPTHCHVTCCLNYSVNSMYIYGYI